MITSHRRPAPSAPVKPAAAAAEVGVTAVVVAVAALAAVGAAIGLQTFGSSGDRGRVPAAVAHAHPSDIARALPTSFGALAVLRVEAIPGLTAKQLAGVTHFPSYVSPDKMQVQVSIQLANRLDRPTAYDPARFRLAVGRRPAVPPTSASIRAGTLQPHAAIEGIVIFVVPRAARPTRLWLEFRERAGARPVRADLGEVRLGRRSAVKQSDHALHHGVP